MKISTRFSDSIHLLSFIVVYKGKIPLTSNTIAGSIQTSPVMVRQLMSDLRKAQLLKTTHGTPNPQLARPAEKISLLDIYLAVEKDKPLFEIDHSTNPDCIVGGNIQPTLEQFYQQAEIAAKAKLAQIKLADVIDAIIVRQTEKEAKTKG